MPKALELKLKKCWGWVTLRFHSAVDEFKPLRQNRSRRRRVRPPEERQPGSAVVHEPRLRSHCQAELTQIRFSCLTEFCLIFFKGWMNTHIKFKNPLHSHCKLHSDYLLRSDSPSVTWVVTNHKWPVSLISARLSTFCTHHLHQQQHICETTHGIKTNKTDVLVSNIYITYMLWRTANSSSAGAPLFCAAGVLPICATLMKNVTVAQINATNNKETM